MTVWFFKRKSKKQELLEKMRAYFDDWDITDYQYVDIDLDGRLLPTNNKDLGTLTLTKLEFFDLMFFIDRNV